MHFARKAQVGKMRRKGEKEEITREPESHMKISEKSKNGPEWILNVLMLDVVSNVFVFISCLLFLPM